MTEQIEALIRKYEHQRDQFGPHTTPWHRWDGVVADLRGLLGTNRPHLTLHFTKPMGPKEVRVFNVGLVVGGFDDCEAHSAQGGSIMVVHCDTNNNLRLAAVADWFHRGDGRPNARR